MVRPAIEPFSPPLQVDNVPIYFNKIVRPLLKDGEINFHILLTVSIQEVRFADGINAPMLPPPPHTNAINDELDDPNGSS